MNGCGHEVLGQSETNMPFNWKKDKPYMWKYSLYTPYVYIYIYTPAIHIYIHRTYIYIYIYIHCVYIYIYTHLHHIQYHLLILKHEFVGILIPYMFKETHELAPKQLAS